ncbi:hypothetical protein GCM10011490_10470 [Pseudoclavibacter endophyticus]|uniref:DNA primase n=1 Tax=Pseudoclavibacter endophyticus TaxID=1778590 RepID=A0A6H9WRW4_9MICO|nr:hypothetical protein [Pseudoclavibacter endophyticus]KAB1649515.1 hypothetical protein F8O04_04450 [Pseudoclavibacter endophyticus]GGA62003.1 hypothetical protein GCM10011490_10470 [Pseudoclavibacter endophyticus]
MQARKIALTAAAAAALALGLAACGGEPATDEEMTTPMSSTPMDEMDTGMDEQESGADGMGDEDMNDGDGMDGEDMENGDTDSEG